MSFVRANDRAATLHDRAIELANMGQYEQSLANFRGAVRATNNTNPTYLSDLGVTEMRMGMFKLALKRFRKALRMEPNLKIALDNLKELAKFMKIEEEIDPRTLPQLHTVLPPKNIDANSFFLFDSIYSIDPLTYNGIRTPLDEVFVVRDFMSVWGLNHEVFKLETLIGRYGHVPVDYYPHNMKLELAKPLFTPLHRAFTHLSNPDEIFTQVDASEPGTYVQWNIPSDIWDEIMHDSTAFLPLLVNDSHWLDKCMPSQADKSKFYQRSHWKMLLVGEKGASMFNHVDTLRTASWQLQLKGRKKWHICPPTENDYMYFPGNIDFFAPNYKKYPKARNATCYQFVVNPGEFVFYPQDHWHQTYNLDTPTVAISGTVATPNSYINVTERMSDECKGKSRVMGPDKRQCSLMTKCFEVWDMLFSNGTNYINRTKGKKKLGQKKKKTKKKRTKDDDSNIDETSIKEETIVTEDGSVTTEENN